MRSDLLFPASFRNVGLVFAALGVFLWYVLYQDQVIIFLDLGKGNLTDEFATTFSVIGIIFFAFSASKQEGDRYKKMRLNALYWAVLLDFVLISTLWVIQYQEEILKGPVVLFKYPLTKVFNYNFFLLLFVFLARYYYSRGTYRKTRSGKQLYLLPGSPFKKIGLFAFLIYLAMLIGSLLFKMEYKNYTFFALFLPGLLLLIWAKEKNELGPVAKIRRKSMQIAFYINYALFLIATWVLYGDNYVPVVGAGMMSTPVIFLMVFYFKLSQFKARGVYNPTKPEA